MTQTIEMKSQSKALDWVGTRLVYKDEVVNMNQYMDDLLADQKVMGDGDKFNEIINTFVKEVQSRRLS